jgi:hypothetical protein
MRAGVCRLGDVNEILNPSERLARIHNMILAAAGGYHVEGNATDDAIPPGEVRLVLNEPVAVRIHTDITDAVHVVYVSVLKQALDAKPPFDVTDYTIVVPASGDDDADWVIPAHWVSAVVTP